MDWMGFERYRSLITALSFGWIIISQKLAEVVGSNPTRSIIIILVDYGIGLSSFLVVVGLVE
jgi:hypothetical protein